MTTFDRRSFLKTAASSAVLSLLPTAGLGASADTSGMGAPDDGSHLRWWRDARFGMFIHWGPVSLKGKEISWSRADRGPVRGGSGSIPADVYDNLYKRFNPTAFDPREWVQLAKEAGMKYLVFTSKHHAGFCMFDTELTDYNITNTPYGKDICAELAEACHEAGLRLGWYYSQPDWHHPHFMTNRHTEYKAFLHKQVRHLLTDYGKIDIMWFDGLGHPPEDWNADDLFAQIHSLQPDIIINDRVGVPGDYDTPEQEIGTFQTDRPWESCITIGTQWAWKPNDDIKSLKECLQTLILCACGDGNLLLNVGPRPTGKIDAQQAKRLREMGDWLDKYGESIYGTRGGPFKPATVTEASRDDDDSTNTVWASTHKDKRVYVHVFNWPGDSVVLPPLADRVENAEILTGGTAEVEQNNRGIEVTVSRQYQQDIDTIIALNMAEPVDL